MRAKLPISALVLDIDGVLTDGRVLVGASGEEKKAISYHDMDAVFDARRRGLQVVLITAEATPWVNYIANRLQVEHVISGAKDKLKAIHELTRRLGVTLENICYVGDSDRDAPALAAVGLGIVPANATREAKAAARIVLQSAGGHGAVHEALSILEEHQLRRESGGVCTDETVGSADDKDTVPDLIPQVREMVAESIAILQAMSEQRLGSIVKASQMITTAINSGHKLLIFGNGGSAADAQHMAADLVGRFERERIPFAAIALTTDTSVLTSLANDYGQEIVFARQIEAIGQRGDVAIAISTSGNSRNVLGGVHAAQRLGIQTIGMTGQTGGELAELVDLCLCVPSDNTARIQEAHGLIIHLLCSLVEADVSYA